MHTSVADWTIP